MRYDVKKILFVGFSQDEDTFFKRAQDLGLVQFLSDQATKGKEFPEDVERLAFAIKILRGLKLEEQEDVENGQIADELAKKVIEWKDSIEKLLEEERMVRLEMARIQVFGNFSLKEVHQIEKEAHKKIQFFAGKRGLSQENDLPKELIFVGEDHGLDYFVSIAPKPLHFEKILEIKIEKSWEDLKERREQIIKEKHEKEQQLQSCAKYSRLFHHELIHRLNKENLVKAREKAKSEIKGALFTVLGWVPAHKIQELQRLVKKLNVHFEEVAIEETDHVPTYLENRGIACLGEDIVHIYDTPSTTDKDPSLWVLAFFTLFFAFIVGDAGYGLVFLAMIAYIRYKTPKPTRVQKKVLTLSTLLSVGVLFWGLMTTSFFGLDFAPDSSFRKISLLRLAVEKKVSYHIEKKDAVYEEWTAAYPVLKDTTDPKTWLMKAAKKEADGSMHYELFSRFSDNIMLELALFLGIIHLILSIVRNLDRNLVNLGWIFALIGAYLYVPQYLEATSFSHFLFGLDKDKSAQEGLYLFLGGTGLAVLIGLIKHQLLGLLEVMTLIQLLADVLSYLRLYALGLAGSIFSATTNELGGMIFIIVGLPVIFAGHSINIILAIMGGVIHGLRLNFLEWYHYCFDGGGRQFNPLKKIEIE